jgi:hypothetical protein
MVFRMSRPTRRKGSRFPQFKDRVPADLVHRIDGRTLVVPVGEMSVPVRLTAKTRIIQFSLRTSDPHEVRVRHAVASAHVESFWAAMREGPARLSQRQAVALAGEVYRDIVRTFEDDPGDPTRWEWLAAFYQHTLHEFLQGGTADSSSGTGLPIVDRLLAKHGLVIDRDSIERLFMEVRRALTEAAERLTANAEGDYGVDANAVRFPDFENAADGHFVSVKGSQP